MARLLVVHHTPSPALHTMFDKVLEGARQPAIDNVEVATGSALTTTASEALTADGFILGCPANLGYMAGALKHFFDTIYYPCLEETRKRPFGLYLHGNDDCSGALTGIQKITTGLDWREVHKPVIVTGSPNAENLDDCWDLGATVAATLSQVAQ